MRRALLILIASAMVVVSCQVNDKSDSLNLFKENPKGKVVAEFDGLKLTDAYLEAYLGQLNPYIKKQYQDPEKKKELVTRMLETEILARKSIKDGTAMDPVLLSKIKNMIARHYYATKLKIEVENKIKVSEDDMKKYYEDNKKAKFTQAGKVKASHILIKTDKKRSEKEAKKIAESVYRKALSAKTPQAFAILAKKYSEDEGTKLRGGTLSYFQRTEDGGKMIKEFSDAAFALKNVGDISKPVKTTFGWHIIRLDAVKPEIVSLFKDAKSRIESTMKADLRKKAFETEIKNIKKESGFKLNEANIAALDLKIPEDVKAQKDPMQKRPQRKLNNPETSRKIKQLLEQQKKAAPGNKGIKTEK